MTKRDRLSYALRRLRNVTAQGDTALRIQKAHEILKEMIDEWSKGAQNADLGQHTIQLLDELYAQNTGAIEDGRLPIPPMMPDCADQIQAQTQVLQAIASDLPQTRRTETATVLHHTLSLFAEGPNAAPIQAFLDTLKKRVKSENARPIPLPDYAKQIQAHTDALLNVDGIKEPLQMREAAVSTLSQALSVFAQGPNEETIQTLLAAVEKLETRLDLDTQPPDSLPQLDSHIEALTALEGLDDPEALTAAASMTLYDVLAEMAKGPDKAPMRALLDAFDKVTGAQ